MLFNKKKCPNCQSEYDVVDATCPACGSENQDVKLFRINQHITWLPWVRQLVIFIIGSLGLQLTALILSFIVGSTMGNTLEARLTLNFSAYVVTIFGLIAALFPLYKKFIPTFKKWVPYVAGIIGSIAILVCNGIYSSIVGVFVESEKNANESLARDMILAYPVVATIMTALLGPICEELTYRVGLFSFLKRVHTVLAYVGTALIFAFIHFDFEAIGTPEITNELINIPYYIGAGIVLSYLYDRFGLASSLTAHISNNLFTTMVVIFLGDQMA